MYVTLELDEIRESVILPRWDLKLFIGPRRPYLDRSVVVGCFLLVVGVRDIVFLDSCEF